MKLKLQIYFVVGICVVVVLGVVFFDMDYRRGGAAVMRWPVGDVISGSGVRQEHEAPMFDTLAYDKKLEAIANVRSSDASVRLWPVKTVYPNAGAILPFHRVVAYYGNLYSKGMGILGEYSEDEVLKRLGVEVEKWNKLDPDTPAVPALHYIAVVAQAGTGRDGKYRLRMPGTEIEKVLAMADKAGGLVFLDVQLGRSDLETELPLLEKYLVLPNVHLGIDPEFAMGGGGVPGKAIGTLDAKDINFAINFLSGVVERNHLTPKILVVHRFTQPMVTHYEKIVPTAEVQVVMNMDGFGGEGNKLNTYEQYIYKEPVQFTGFKLFYKNDVQIGKRLLGPEDLLRLSPVPVYIQYQ